MSSIITAIGLACLTMGNLRHSGVRRLGWAVWIASAVAWTASCASSEDAGDAFPRGADWGGQTGSLVPPTSGPSCGPVTGKDRVLTLAGVAPTLLINADGSELVQGDAGATEDHWYITDANGDVIDLMDPVAEGTALLVPEDDLAPGNYELNYRCGGVDQTVELVIEEPKPAPKLVQSASLWYPPSEYTCESIKYKVSVTVTLSTDAPALVDTAEIAVVGQGFSTIVAPFASIDPDATTFEFAVPICRSAAETNCVAKERTGFAIVTSWLDETLPEDSQSLFFDANCDDEPPPEDSPEPSRAPDEGACSLSSHRAPLGALAWMLSLLVSVGWIRRRGRSASLQRRSGPKE